MTFAASDLRGNLDRRVFLAEESGFIGGVVPRKLRAIKKDLRHAGAYVHKQRGSHAKWKHPLVSGTLIELSGNDNDDAAPYQEDDLQAALQRIAAAERNT